MIDINKWMDNYKKLLLEHFKDRIIFIGLQGSYARNEAASESDIDVVAIFDYLTIEDLKKYDTIISSLPYREKICGFVSGKNELINWEKSDLFQFYNDTKAIYGSLDFIAQTVTIQDVKHAILTGVCNIYHTCCHNIIHEKSIEILKAISKQATFVLQAKYYYKNHTFVQKKNELRSKLSSEDKAILDIYYKLNSVNSISNDAFDQFSNELFLWCSKLIKEYSDNN